MLIFDNLLLKVIVFTSFYGGVGRKEVFNELPLYHLY